MKKWLFSVYVLSILLLAGCWNNTPFEQEVINTKNETWVEATSNTLEDAIINYISTNYDCKDWSKLFVNYAELWQKSLGDWIAERYVTTIAEWFYIDERWNLNNSCWFSIPMKITLSTEDWANYIVTDAIQARDGNEHDKSIREMFSDEAIDRLYNWNVRFVDNRPLVEIAEEYYNVKIIPDEQQTFECKFCSKLWYYEPLENNEWKNNDLIFNYVSEDNWNNTIYFDSDWTFKAKWSWDAWTWTRKFGQDENTIIVLNNSIDHVYDRYIITNVDDNNLNTILEIIQRK